MEIIDEAIMELKRLVVVEGEQTKANKQAQWYLRQANEILDNDGVLVDTSSPNLPPMATEESVDVPQVEATHGQDSGEEVKASSQEETPTEETSIPETKEAKQEVVNSTFAKATIKGDA